MPNMNKVVRTHREKCPVCHKLVKLERFAALGSDVELFRYARHNTPLGGRCIGGGSPSKFQYPVEPTPKVQP